MSRMLKTLALAAALAVPTAPAIAAAPAAPVFEQPPAGTPNLTGKWMIASPPRRLLTAAGAEPPLNAAGKAAYAANQAALKANRKADPITDCVPHGVPRIIYSPHPMLILQTTRLVTFIYEANHTVRTVWWNAPPPEDPTPLWLGDPSARWDGKTLVVDTVNLNDKTWLDWSGLPHGEKLKVQERYTLASPTTIRGEVMIEDPDFYTAPWKTRFTLRKLPGMTMTERACGEDHVM
jgi:hypothetical protein